MFPRTAMAIALAIAIGSTLSCATVPDAAQAPKPGMTVTERMDLRGLPVFKSDKPDIYLDGPSWGERALELVEGARDYIFIEVFLGNVHEITKPILDALVDRARAGVRVYYIIDSSSVTQDDPLTGRLTPSAYDYLKRAGVKMAEYNPISGSELFFLPGLLDRDHRKYWIIDGKTLAVGGLNLNYNSMAPLSAGGHIDLTAVLSSEGAVRAMVRSFVRTWNMYSVEKLSADDFAAQPGGRDYTVRLVDQGPGDMSTVGAAFDSFLEGTREELWLVEAYTVVTPALLKSLREAVARGVAVHVLLSSVSINRDYVQAALYGARDLIRAGVDVRYFETPEDTLLHMKLILADGKTAMVGSPNLNFRSRTMSRELALVYDDEALGLEFRGVIDKLLESSRRITPEEAEGYKGFPYFLSFLFMQVFG